jgi:hypothetical protein
VKDKLTMRQFGHWGRAGNQFFQYSFLTDYARQYNLELQLPPWVGNHLFGTNDLPITTNLPTYTEKGGGLHVHEQPLGDVLVNHDFQGYAQYHTSYYASDRDRIRSLFQPFPTVFERLKIPAFRLTYGKTVVGIHLRRGDYGRGIFPIIPTSWYLKWLNEHWYSLKSPKRLFIATEDPSLVSEFAEYKPITTETLGIDLDNKPMANCVYLNHDLKTHDSRAMDWYPDFYLLSQCDIIVGPSSTFSFFAAMINPKLKEYWRARLAIAEFEKVDPWNDWPLLREHVRDYPHLDGITDPSNPYFVG